MWKRYHLSIEGIPKWYFNFQKWYIQGWGLAGGTKPPRFKRCWLDPPPPLGMKRAQLFFHLFYLSGSHATGIRQQEIPDVQQKTKNNWWRLRIWDSGFPFSAGLLSWLRASIAFCASLISSFGDFSVIFLSGYLVSARFSQSTKVRQTWLTRVPLCCLFI